MMQLKPILDYREKRGLMKDYLKPIMKAVLHESKAISTLSNT